MPADLITVVSPTIVGSVEDYPLPGETFGDVVLTLGGKRVTAVPNAMAVNEDIMLGWGQVGAQIFSGYHADNGLSFPVGSEAFSPNLAGGTGSAPVAVGGFTVDEFDCEDLFITWESVDSPRIIDVLVLGEKLEVVVGSVEVTSGTGNFAVTGLGFEPQLMFFQHHLRAAFGVGAAADAHGMNFGAADGTRQFATSTSTSFADPSNTRRQTRDDCVAFWTGGGPYPQFRFALDSFDADGFTLNRVVSRGTTMTVAYVAFADPTLVFEVGSFLQGETSVSFNDAHTQPPDALFFFGGGNTVLNTIQDNCKYGYGMGTLNGDMRTIFGEGRDNRPTSQTASGYFDTGAIGYGSWASTVEYLAALDSMDANGFELSNITDDGVDRIVCYATLTGREETEPPCGGARIHTQAWLV